MLEHHNFKNSEREDNQEKLEEDEKAKAKH